MAAGLERVIDLVHSIAKLPDGGQSSDLELLDRYLTHADQLAFTELVHRHGCMVLNVCKRILTNHQDAEDAFQATFLILAGKAHKVRQRSIGSWLHTVAYRTALTARTRRRQRTRFETTMDALPEPKASPPEAESWRHELDLAVRQLPVKYREPIVLCELGGVSRRATARQLGVPEGTLSSRLNRARAMLARRLRQRGIEPLAFVLGRGAISSTGGIISKTLIDQTCRLAVLMAVHGSILGTSSIGMLMQGVQKTMWIAKWRAAIGVTGMLALLAVGGLSSFSTTLTAAPEQAELLPNPPMQGGAVVPGETSKILQEIIRGHRANREAIRTLHVKFQTVSETPFLGSKHGDRQIEWWQQGDKIIRETQHWVERLGWESGVYFEKNDGPIRSETTEDTFSVLGKSMCLETSKAFGRSESRQGRIGMHPGGPTHVNLWYEMGFGIYNRGDLEVAELLSSPDWSKSIQRTVVDNHAFLEVLCRQNQMAIELTIDPSKGYLVTRREIWFGANKKEASFLNELGVDEIRECLPGVYFPTHSLMTTSSEIRMRKLTITGISESWIDLIEVNQPVPGDRFANPIPEGVNTVDSDKDWRYTMGPDGNPLPSEPVYSRKSGAVIRKPK